MTLRRISEPEPKELCLHPEHEPPQHMVYKPGTYENVCPGCGHKQTFTIEEKMMLGQKVSITSHTKEAQ